MKNTFFSRVDFYLWINTHGIYAPSLRCSITRLLSSAATLVWWQSNRIHFYPFIQIIGISALLYSIFMRRQALAKPIPDNASITGFYISLLFLTMSLALGYSSLFLFAYVIIIGYPLILGQRIYEIKRFKKFEKYVYEEKKINKINTKNYFDLWEAYMKIYCRMRGKK